RIVFITSARKLLKVEGPRGGSDCSRYRPIGGCVMGITLPDSRGLPDDVLQALRLRALHAIESGFSQADVARVLGVACETVSRWWTAYTAGGLETLPQDRTGRPVGTGRTLSDEQCTHL